MRPQQKYMILIRGLSGSGKRTVADLICGSVEDDSRIAISANDYFYSDTGTFEFDATKLKDAHIWCLSEVETCILQGYETIVIHNTFSRKWEVEPYLKIACKNGYRISILSLYDSGLSDTQLAQRSEYGVPLHSIRRQRARWESDIYTVSEAKAPKKHTKRSLQT